MENLRDLDAWENPHCRSDERKIDEDRVGENKVDEDCEIVAAEPKKKRQKRGKSKQVKLEEDDNKRNWLDSEVETLIALKGEMQPEFIKNAKKQGVDMWLKLHSKLLCLQPNFKKTPKACKSKFNDLLKAYKDNKLANNISGESRHNFRFYDSMDSWYHQNGSVLKHISASSTDMPSPEGNVDEAKAENSEPTPPPTSKKGKSNAKIKYQESALELMGQMVVNSKDMAHNMKEANGFMSNLDKHMERLIDKL